MADGRMLKKVICESPRLAALKNDTHRLIYTWIIPFLDVEGRHSADPRLVKSHVAPILDHITHKIIASALRDMAGQELIKLYTVNGKQYLELLRFKKHQNLREDREKKSDIPPPPPGQLPEGSGITPKQANLSEVNLSEAKGDTPEPPVDNPPPFESVMPQKEDLTEEPKPEQPKPRNGKDDAYLEELKNLVAQVKTKYPRYPIEQWYGRNIKAPPDKIIQVLRNFCKADLKCDGNKVIDTYLQNSIDVETGKTNARLFEAEQEGKKGPTTARGMAAIGEALRRAGAVQ